MLLFIHIPTVDFAGHDFGWVRADTVAPNGEDVLGVRYAAAALAADSVVNDLWLALHYVTVLVFVVVGIAVKVPTDD